MRKAPLLVPVILVAALGGCDSTKTSSSVVETCARLSACGLEDGSLGECRYVVETVERVVRKYPSSSEAKELQSKLDCALAASTCDQLRACSEPTDAQRAACDTTADNTCSGTVLVHCMSDTTFDCAKAGLVCGASEEGAACGLATCDPATTPPSCDGKRLLTCDEQGHVLTSVDCSQDGRTCGRNSAGEAACASNTPCPSYADSAFRCDGATMVACHDGSEARTDCSDILGPEWTCQATVTDTSRWTGCVPVAKDCTVGVDESCANGVVTYCNAGRVATFDCRSLGFSGCAAVPNNTTTVANCVQ